MIKGIPNPDRYESGEFEGELVFLDKSTGTLIRWEPLKNSLEKSGKLPSVKVSPKQPDFCVYLKDRKSELLENWDNEYLLEPDQKNLEELLREIKWH